MTQTLRQRIVAEARWGVANEPSIHYAETRPIPLAAWKAHTLPITTDCSGFVTCCYYRAGAPNPNGYEGTYQATQQVMYTGTLLAAGEAILLASAQPGDYVIYGASGSTVHTALIVETGSDPLLASHGFEGGPQLIRLSASRALHPGQPITIVRSLPAVAPKPVAPSWDVTAGDGTLIAHGVRRPALWAVNHWRIFRTRSQVTFRRHP